MGGVSGELRKGKHTPTSRPPEGEYTTCSNNGFVYKEGFIRDDPPSVGRVTAALSFIERKYENRFDFTKSHQDVYSIDDLYPLSSTSGLSDPKWNRQWLQNV
ncbi:hypothetical protein ACFE04_008313 [Oxalis oulophora]